MLILRKIYEKDLEMIMHWRMQPEVTRYMYTDPVLTIDIQKSWYRNIVQNEQNYIRIINFNEIDIGLYSLTEVKKKGNCFWAYYIANTSFQGMGLGKIIECNNYDYAFEQLDVHKVSCEVFAFNEKVVSIHKKYGAQIEGVFKEHIGKNNEYFDIVRMAILKNEWLNIRNNIVYEKCIIE